MVGRTIAHYRVIEEIGGGGMGIVYRARDLKLDRLVALKFLPPRLRPSGDHAAAAAEREARFIHEAKTASALDHPNICTIFTIDETADGRLYIAMAWYQGETLRTKIRRGALRPDQVVDFGAQIAAGLAAAHARGIVHRDIKPANLMVTRDGVVKLLDFGLSKFVGGLPDLGADPDRLMGTAAYMAPEQIHEDLADEQSDVWAVGVVLYEMLAGVRPFRGPNDLAVLFAVANQDPDLAADTEHPVPAALDAIITKALARDRGERYSGAAELAADLDALRVRSQSGSQANIPIVPEIDAPRQRRGVAAALAGLALAGVLGWQLFLRPSSPIGELAGPRTVVSVGLADGSAMEDRWACEAVSELIGFVLADVGGIELRRADRSSLNALQRPGGYDSTRGIDTAILGRIRGVLGDVTAVLGGTCRVDPGERSMHVELKLQDPTTGEPSGTWAETGQIGRIVALASRLGTPLAEHLGGSIPAAAERTVHPIAPAVAEALDSASTSLRQLDAPTALAAVDRAAAIAPYDPHVLGTRVDVLLQLGRIREATAVADEAVRAARRWPLEARAAVRARALEAAGDGSRSAAVLRALWGRGEGGETFDVEQGISLAWLLARNAEDAAVHEVLGQLRSAGIDDPRIVLIEATAARQQARNREQVDALRRGLGDELASEMPLVWARARLLEVQPLRRLGSHEEAMKALEDARAVFEARGLRMGVADTWNEQGNLEWDRQDLLQAKESFEKAAFLYRSLGNDRMGSRLLQNQALVLDQLGDVDVASELYRQAIELLRPLGDPVAEVFALTNHANLLVRSGRFAEADAAFARGQEIDQTIDSVDTHAWLRSCLGNYRAIQGRLADATRLIDESLELARPAGDRLQIADASMNQGRMRLDRGDVPSAIASFELARVQFEDNENRGAFLSQTLRELADAYLTMGVWGSARDHLAQAQGLLDSGGHERPGEMTRSLAVLALAEGRLDDADQLARAAIESFASAQAVLELARAYDVLGSVQLAGGDPEAARESANEGLSLLADISAPVIQIPLRVTQARAVLAEGEFESARRALLVLHAETVRLGLGRWELEVRLALAEVDLAGGDAATSRQRLEPLIREARGRGLGALAERAEALSLRVPRSPLG